MKKFKCLYGLQLFVWILSAFFVYEVCVYFLKKYMIILSVNLVLIVRARSQKYKQVKKF